MAEEREAEVFNEVRKNVKRDLLYRRKRDLNI